MDSARFFDALVFDVAMQGTDAHAKNSSLLLDGDRARLAPLYDLGSHAPYPTRGRAPLRLAMSIEGEYRIDAVGADLLVRAGISLGLDADTAHDRAVDITSGVAAAFDRAAEEARAMIGDHAFIDAMVDSVAAYSSERGWS